MPFALIFMNSPDLNERLRNGKPQYNWGEAPAILPGLKR
jgi:hypothetical protein